MFNMCQLEQGDVFQSDKDAAVEVRAYVKPAYLAVGKSDGERIVSVCVHRSHFGQFFHRSFPQRVDFEELLAVCCQIPIGHEFFSMNFNPCPHQLERVRGNGAGQ